MTRRHWYIGWSVALGLAAMALLAPDAGAQSGGLYSLKGTIAAGGTVTGGSYRVANSLGLVTGGKSSGGAYTVQGELVRTADIPGATDQEPAEQNPDVTPRLFLPFAGR